MEVGGTDVEAQFSTRTLYIIRGSVDVRDGGVGAQHEQPTPNPDTERPHLPKPSHLLLFALVESGR